MRQFPKGAPARGAVGASRLRGASPPGGRDILQNPAGLCMRRGRCSHRPAACPRRRQRGLMQASLPARAAQTSRRCKGPARCRTPPSPSGDTSPYRGGFFAAVSQRRPCKGSCRRQPTEGCIAARRQRYPAKPGRALPRMRRGRCPHRPASFPAAAAFSGPMKIIGPCAGFAQPGKIPGKATRQCTPPSAPAAHPPLLAGEAFLRQRSKGAPARGAVGASRLRGASPPGGRDILQNPAGPYLACVGDDARIVPRASRQQPLSPGR